MRIFAAVLALCCLALAACPERAAGQQVPGYPVPGYPVMDYPAPGEEQISSGFGLCPNGCCPVDQCLCRSQVWASAEFLYGFRKSRQVPPLVTSSVPGTDQIDAGVLGLDSTSILLGDEGLQDNPQPGVRGEGGFWLDSAAQLGVEGSFTAFAEDLVAFSESSDGSRIIARPFFDTSLNRERSLLVSFPDLVAGSVDVQSPSDIYSAEIYLRKRINGWPGLPPAFFLIDCCVTRLDFIAGYQHTHISDSLSINHNLVSLDPAFLGQIGTTLNGIDRFEAENEFHGITLGLKSVSRYPYNPIVPRSNPYERWSLTMLGKLSIGNMQQTVNIDGQTVIAIPDGPSEESIGGLLTHQSNIGTFDRDRLTLVPEARIMLNYNINSCVSLGVGYNFIYWNHVAFSGDHVDRRVDLNDSGPAFVFRDRDFFIHAGVFQLQLKR